MGETYRIREELRRVRRAQIQRQMLGAGEATLWIAVACIALGAALIGLFSAPVLRLVIWASLVVSLGSLWATQVLLPALRSRSDSQYALSLERRFRELRSDLSSSLEFGAALRRRDLDLAGSPALMRAHITATERRFKRVRPALERRLPSYRIPWLARVGLVSSVAMLVVFLAAPDVARYGLRSLFFGHMGNAALAAVVEVPDEPVVARIYTTYRYPAYTRRHEVRIANPTGRLEVLAGTEVTIEAIALTQVQRASVHVTQGGATAGQRFRVPDGRSPDGADGRSEDDPEDDPEAEAVETVIGVEVVGRDLRVSFTPLQSGSYHFEIVDGSGQRRRDPVERAIMVVVDAPPQVHLLAPDTVVEAAPTDVIAFRFSASDDFGLTELGFVHNFAGQEYEQRQSLVTLDGELVFQDAAGFDLAPLMLRPRDEIFVYVEAVDNDGVQGAKAGRSRPVLIRITAPEDRHLAIIEQEAEVFEALLDILGDYLENPIADMRLGTGGSLIFEVPDLPHVELHGRYQSSRAISQKVVEVLSVMRRVLDQMEGDELMLRRDFELFSTLYEGLYDLNREEQSVLTQLSNPASRGTLNRYHLQRIESVRSRQVSETESAVLLLEELVSSQRMESLQNTLEELDQIQARLRELLEEYQETRDEALRAQIEQELARLESRMQELLQRLAQQMQQLPSEHYNVQALQEQGLMGDPGEMTDALDQIRQMLEAGDIEAALDALDDLQAQLESMQSQLNSSQSSGGGGGLSELDERLSELMDDLSDLAAQESELEQETALLEQDIRERRVEALQEELDAFLEEALETLEQMQASLEEIPLEEMRSDVADALSHSENLMEDLAQSLEAGDVDTSLNRAQSLRSRLATAERQLRNSARHLRGTSREEVITESHDTTSEVREQADELAERLDEFMERAQPTPEASDMGQLQELAESQGMTVSELAELLQRVDELSQDMPMISEELAPGLQRAESYMEGAERSVRGSRLPRARDDMQDALSELRQLRDQMFQMVERERMGRRQDTQPEHVEIPEEPDQTPAEFRQDILDAMREESVETYRDQIRRYYERLVE